jgi:hypothetical protein
VYDVAEASRAAGMFTVTWFVVTAVGDRLVPPNATETEDVLVPKLVPVIVMVNDDEPGATIPGEIALIVGVEITVRAKPFEGPPPGAGLVTTTL